MAKNLISAVVNTSIMEGTEATYTVDVRDYCGSSVDVSLVTLEWGVNASDGTLVASGRVSWESTLDVHQMTFPELSEGIYEYHISITEDDGSRSVLVQGTLGVFNADSWQEPVLTTNSPNRCLRIWRADGKEQIEASWLATAAAEGFAYTAKKYAKYLEDAMPLIEQAKAFIESFDEALREAIEVRDNYLYISGVNTGHYLKGEDGVTPSYGRDGYWYINGKKVGKARGDDGLTPYITSDGYWAIGEKKTNVRAAGRDGIDGAAIRRVKISGVSELPKEEQKGVFYYIKQGDGYDVYVWLEPVGWEKVGEANDFATYDVHGVVKLGTFLKVDGGAPVGTDSNERMAVPQAQLAVPGVGKLSTDDITLGAAVGMDISGAFRTARADATQHGSVQLSYAETIPATNCIGEQADGRMSVVPAGLGQHGVIKAGSVVYELAPEPYRFANGIAAATTGEHHSEIVSNLVFGGAIKQMSKYSWLGLSDVDMPWLSAEFATAWPPADTILWIGGVPVVLGKGAGEYDFNLKQYLLAWKDVINASSAPVTAELVVDVETPILELTSKAEVLDGSSISLYTTSEAMRLSGSALEGGTIGTPAKKANVQFYWTRDAASQGSYQIRIDGVIFRMHLPYGFWLTEGERQENNAAIRAMGEAINAANLSVSVTTSWDPGGMYLVVLNVNAREAGVEGNDIKIDVLVGGQRGGILAQRRDNTQLNTINAGDSVYLDLGEDAIPGKPAKGTIQVGEDEKSGPWFGLHTSASFTQSRGLGLRLNSAKGNMVGGVYMAAHIDDDREAAVFSVSNLKDYLGRYYYTADKVYTKAGTESAINKALDSYATKSWVDDNYMQSSEVEDKLADKIDCPSKRISHLEIITASEREAMTSMNSKTVYLVIAG